MKLKVLVVDDSALYRQLVKNVLKGLPDVDVVGLASSGKEALLKIPELQPDFMTLDVQMPELNGLELLREIKKRRMSVKAIMLSSLTAHGAQATTDALLAGAFDFIQKPSCPDPNINRTVLEERLNEKIDALRESLHATMPTRKSNPASMKTSEHCEETIARCSKTLEPKETDRQPRLLSKKIHAVVIGTSTGGPVALREVIPKLPATLGVPIFVVQHMPPNYTKSLAIRIGENSQLPVQEASHGMLVEANHVYIAPGGLHMGVALQRGKWLIQTSDEPPEHNCRPAVDYTLRSIADAYAGNVLVVILTGMGRDGTEGCRLIKHLGGTVFAQHPEGCVVYGMPKAIVEEQLADRVVPIEKMASWIVRRVEAC